ncbi:MAG: hypothetical protein ABL958_21580, partial [Bdellovibrionia bacterium]
MRRILLLLACSISACTQQSFDFKAQEVLSGITTPRIEINGGAEFTNNLGVLVTTFSPDTKWMHISNDPHCADASEWIGQSDKVTWTLGTENARNQVFARFRSRNGFETDCVQATIVHDNLNPLVDIVERPADLHDSDISRFKFAGLDDGSGLDYFECQLTGSGFIPCPPLANYSGLGEGIRNLSVRAVDRAGNRSEPENAQWLIDTIAPDVM